MDNKRFEEILEERIVKIKATLGNKGREYASNTDRLHNFKMAAKLTSHHLTSETALLGMMRKHLVSMIDMVDDTQRGIYPSPMLVDEKLGDVINYTILLEALFTESWEQVK